MANRLDRPLFGWLTWDPRFGMDNLAVNDGSTLGSSYSQVNPRPGIPELVTGTDDARVQISGAQGQTIDAKVVTTGMPGIEDDDACLALRDPDGENTWLTWSADRFSRWEMVQEATLSTNTLDTFDCETHRTTGRVAIGTRRNARYWDEETHTWELATGWVTGGTDGGIGMCSLPSGRMLAISKGSGITTRKVQFSDDGGINWASYSTNCMPTTFPKDTVKLAAANQGNNIFVLAESDDGSGDLYQLASTDQGSSFLFVQQMSGKGHQVSACEVPGAGIGVVYQRDSDNVPVFVGLESATRELTSGDEVEIDGAISNVDGLTIWSTCDGILFVLMSDRNGDGTELRVYRSTDAGETWVAVSEPGHMDDNSDLRLTNLASTWGPNGAVILHNLNSTTSGDRDLSLCALHLGGWSNLQQDTGEQYTAGTSGGSSTAGGLYLPVDTLAASSWSVTFSGGGAETLGEANNLTDGVQAFYPASNTSLSTRWLVDVRVNSGGSPASDIIFAQVRWGNGSTIRRYNLRLSDSGGWRLYDDLTSLELVSDLTYDVTERTQFMIAASEILVKRPYERVWTIHEFSGSTSAGAGTGLFTWEQTTTTSPDVDVFGFGFDESSNNDTTDVNGFDGRPVSSVPVWTPPFGDTQGTKVALVDGPATSGSEWTIPPSYDYGIDKIEPTSGSPDSLWLSGESTEQVLTWDLGTETFIGPWMGLYVENPRFQTAYLEHYDGSTWVTSATLDLGVDFTGIDYTRTGDSIYPTSSPATPATRYLQSGEMVGGYVVYDPAGSPVAEIIRKQKSGSWASAGTSRPILSIGEAGTDPGGATTGVCNLVAPQGYVLTDVGNTTARYWRVRLPAQTVPTGGIGAGTILVGTLHGVGVPPGWAWSEGNDPNVSRTRSPYGTPSSTQLGPMQRTWTWAWSEGQILTGLRGTDLDIDYLSPEAGTSAAVTADDVWWQLQGLMEVTEGGTLPCVALRIAAGDDESINDPTRMLFCEVETGPSVSGMAGTEGTDEATRVEGITMRQVA